MSSIEKKAKRVKLFRDLAPTEQVSTSSLTAAEQWRRSSLLESNARPVAIEDKVDEILRRLDDPAHHVIAVVGMGGVGKTFLLQNVYKDPRTKGLFEKCIWLSISQTYSLKTVQSDMASSLNLDHVVSGNLSEQRAAELIREKLDGNKFLIVLDDVWRATEYDNLIEKIGIPAANTQCRTVVTTRSKEVCRVMNASSIYDMEVLGKEDSWKLFCAYAFPDEPQNRPPHQLKELPRQVESKCGRLPMALKTVGASMANRLVQEEWEYKLQKLEEVRKGEKKHEDCIMEILKLSYDSLPAHLKPCFLYFAFFGEDEEIDVDYLIELWRAEGFVPEGDRWRITALEYFYLLTNLCLVEARENSDLQKFCKMHDLLRDLAISICKENSHGCTREDVRTNKRDSSGCIPFLSQPDRGSGCRRIFLAKQRITDDDMSDNMLLFPTFLRTLSLGNNPQITNIPASVLSNVRVLRILDLSYTDISTLPSSIGNLKLLRVLNLHQTAMKNVPECIRSLRNLSVLRIFSHTGSFIELVPEWIGELKCLERLEIRARTMPKTLSGLLFLRFLFLDKVVLSVEDNGLLRLEHLKNLSRLQELFIEIHCESELQRMEEVFEHLENMRWLSVWNEFSTREENDVPLFPDKLGSMRELEYLRLWRFVLPRSTCDLVNLKVLILWVTNCSEYPALEKLPNLTTLRLLGNTKCRALMESFGTWGAFPKLRHLTIVDFSMLEEFRVLEEGSMPCLEEFFFLGCT